MTLKLFTIGDSISQGFMSLAAARTDSSYCTLIAEKLDLQPNSEDYRYPIWPANGLPVDLEAIMRGLYKRIGIHLDLIEWPIVLQTVNEILDEAEDFYERGPGRANLPYGEGNIAEGDIRFFHNIAVQGFKIADAWLVTPELCEQYIQLHDKKILQDGYLQGPSVPFYRTALKVLNPSRQPQYCRHSALKWLDVHCKGEGIENLVLWLGANHALGTVLDLTIRQTPAVPEIEPYKMSHSEREQVGRWNLWHPDDFKAEYDELLKRADASMKQNVHQDWKVFLATIPMVTIAPLAKGVGGTTTFKRNIMVRTEAEPRQLIELETDNVYYKYYTYFPFEESFAHETGIHLTMQDALLIDDSIREFNRHIHQAADALNEKHKNEGDNKKRYYVVDIAYALDQMAYKRNASRPTYDFPDYFKYKHPQVNTKYYHADEMGRLKQGGIVSLDGVHPTVIGQGLIAYEFLKEMTKAGVTNDHDLEWEEIFANDRLYQEPIPLMHELYEHERLAEFIIELLHLVQPKN